MISVDKKLYCSDPERIPVEASFSINPITQPHPPEKLYFSAADHKISTIKQSKQPQPKLATQS